MTLLTKVPRQGKLFYGWWIVGASAFAWLLHGGLYYYGFSAFFTPLVKEFGWSRAALSGAFSLARLENGILAPIAGFLVDRLGPRRVVFAGMVLMGLGFVIISQVSSLVVFYIVFIGLLSGGATFGMGIPLTATITNWFRRRRSTALGLSYCGVGLGGAVVPALAWAIEAYGWRTAALAAAAFLWLAAIPVAALMRHRPEPYGLLPDGDTPPPRDGALMPFPLRGASGGTRVSRGEAPSEINFTPGQALRTSAFWVLCIAFALRQLVTSGIGVHLIPLLIVAGYPPQTAATIMGLAMALSIPGRLLFGWLGDRFDKRLVIASCLGLQMMALLFLGYFQGLWQVAPFVFFYALGYGGSIPVNVAIWGEYYGRNSFGAIQGLAQVVQMWGTMGGPFLAGLLFDLTQSYARAFLLFFGALIGGITLVLAARRPRLTSPAPPAPRSGA